MVDTKSKHPDFAAWENRWTTMRDVSDGEEAVKDKNIEYLPKPSGFGDGTLGDKAYAAYKMRAQFPDILSPTVRGMVGIIHNKPATFHLPSALEPMREKATRDGLTLESMHRRVTREILSMGRYGLMVDISSTTSQPYLAGYITENIPNWGENDEQELNFVLLDESSPMVDEETLTWTDREAYRLLRMVKGSYTVQTFIQGGSGQVIESEPLTPKSARSNLGFIPFVFIDTNDLTPTPDEIPLLGLGRVSLSIYRLDADYRHQLFNTGQEMWVYIGGDPEEIPKTVGSGVALCLPVGGDAKVVGPQGKGIEAHRQAIKDELDKAVALGARMFAEERRQIESGEAHKMKAEANHATLKSISRNTAAGLERALRYAATWVGANPEEVVVEPNLDFTDVELTPAEMDALVRGWQAEAYSYETLYENLQRGGIASPDRDAAEEQELIVNGLGAPPADEEDGSGEEDEEENLDPGDENEDQ